MHRDDLAARVRRQHRDAAPLQRVAMVVARRALPADVAQRRADDHRVPPQRAGPDARRRRRRAAASASRARRRRRCRRSTIARSRRDSASRCWKAMGLTECASVAFANPLDPALRKIGSPGRPLGMEARVVAPDGAVLRRRRARRDRTARRQRDAGLPQGPRGDGAHAARRGLARDGRPRLSRRRRLLFHHRPPEGADHQGRREHRAARDRRGAAAAPGGAGGGGGRHSRSRIRTGDPGLRRAEAGQRMLGSRSARAIAWPSSAATRRRRHSASSPSCRRGRRARCSG